uniref:Uncharacterized protein n=1 Tax=Octopus bimaculoides TaxID=37653 RepID=A0A0L8HPB3_OCTBM
MYSIVHADWHYTFSSLHFCLVFINPFHSKHVLLPCSITLALCNLPFTLRKKKKIVATRGSNSLNLVHSILTLLSVHTSLLLIKSPTFSRKTLGRVQCLFLLLTIPAPLSHSKTTFSIVLPMTPLHFLSLYQAQSCP